MFDLTSSLSVFDDLSVLQNFHIMEPLRQPDASEESALGQEAQVASVRSTLRELRESIEELCKANLHKILTTCLFSLLLFSFAVFFCRLLIIRGFPSSFLGNSDTPMAPTSNRVAETASGAAGAAADDQSVPDSSAQDSSKSPGTLPRGTDLS